MQAEAEARTAETADAVVVGAGFAGTMTAAALVARGFGKVIVLEQEPVPGFHASGRNAAIARRVAEHPAVTALAARSVRLMTERVTPEGDPLLKRTGGVLLGSVGHLQALVEAIPDTSAEARALRAEVRWEDPAELPHRWPWLAGVERLGAISTAGCGVVDIHGLLRSALAQLRGRVRLRARLLGVDKGPTGVVCGVRTSAGAIATPLLINAAGFRANAVAALAGARAQPFNPVRRHLFTSAPDRTVRDDAPWFWDIDAGWYLRREGPGLLLCACDATPWGPSQPEDPPRDPAARELAASRFTRCVPGLSGVEIQRDWAGLRVLTPDQAFVIGMDPEVPGLFWVSGLGGHGMTTSCGVGELAADLLTDRPVPPLFEESFSPARFFAPEPGP